MKNPNSFIEENASENVICEMAAIFSQPQCVHRDDKGQLMNIRSATR